MQWLNEVVDEVIKRQPEGEIVVSSGVSPSGTYHLGTLREVLTAEAILRELKRRGRQAKHLHIVDDLDVFRKVPVDVPAEFEKYLGQPLCDVPAPDGSKRSYADFFLDDLLVAAQKLELEMEVIRAHQKYRAGFFTKAIEQALAKADAIRDILESISGHKLDDNYSPVQVIEEGYLKNRRFVSIDKQNQTIDYIDAHGQAQSISYAKGQVKLNWRIDWPARWWLLNVDAEPFGRDHATKGGSYDTGAAIIKQVFGAEPPIPLPYAFINRTGDTKKMSKSAGDTITAAELLSVLPPEIVWYFILHMPPDKQLFFDQGPALIRLIDDFGALLAKSGKTAEEQQLIELTQGQVKEPTISSVPFSHLVSSYQAALKDPAKTLEIVARTEYSAQASQQAAVIKEELKFIDSWLSKWAPEEVKFSLADKLDTTKLNQPEKKYLKALSEKISQAPDTADGEWFHKAIYDLSQAQGLDAKAAFSAIYKVTIGQASGPRAGWFLSTLPRKWLVKRLALEA